MKKNIALFLFISMSFMLIISCSTSIKKKDEPIAKMDQDEKMAWWREAKFGLFIHWGVYAVPAGKYGDDTTHGEWIMSKAQIPVAEYKEYAAQFNPVEYDPVAWVKMAKDAGMRYIVITSKHHDGFALYPSEVTEWDVADASPYGKDLLGPLVDEGKKAGVKVGFYYSQSQDWVHPGGTKQGFGEEGWDEAHRGDFDTYLAEIALPQVKEILTRYPIDILWWDTPGGMRGERTTPFVEALKIRPNIITNNRLGISGDTRSVEGYVPMITPEDEYWEVCMTMNFHWGWNPYDPWRTSELLIHQLTDVCSKGGNYLLNIGPKANGEFPEQCMEILADFAAWMKVNSESIHGTTKGPFGYLSWGAATRKDDLLYLHVWEWPEDGKLNVPISSKVVSAALMVDPEEMLPFSLEQERIVIDVPAEAPDPIASVIILKIEEEPVTPPPLYEGKIITASSEKPGSPAMNAGDGSSQRAWTADADGESYLEMDLEEFTWIIGTGIEESFGYPKPKQTLRMEALTPDGWKECFTLITTGYGVMKNFDPVQATKVRMYVTKSPEGPASIEEWRVFAAE
ncbi:MAG TPA: alpha-L-fucosidase [Bacteroidales bacterium]|nr:alpha-L-fucosidase [Bacteroidales bacterium]